MVMPELYQPVQTRRAVNKNNIFILILKLLQNKYKLRSKMINNNEAVTFNMKMKPCILMDQSEARCMRVEHCKSVARRVSCGRLHTDLSQVFKNTT